MPQKRRNQDIDLQLQAELAEACANLSPLESALLIAQGLRQVRSGEWVIEAHADGSFSVLART